MYFVIIVLYLINKLLVMDKKKKKHKSIKLHKILQAVLTAFNGEGSSIFVFTLKPQSTDCWVGAQAVRNKIHPVKYFNILYFKIKFDQRN